MKRRLGGQLSDEIINLGIAQYINENNALLKPYLFQKEKGKKKYTQESAAAELADRLRIQYFQ